jgi:hypothetical protein
MAPRTLAPEHCWINFTLLDARHASLVTCAGNARRTRTGRRRCGNSKAIRARRGTPDLTIREGAGVIDAVAFSNALHARYCSK